MTSKRNEKKKQQKFELLTNICCSFFVFQFEWHSNSYQFTLIKLIKNADQCNNKALDEYVR